ncbi:sporulation protein [Lactonifactor sp. BIOML-A3]|uniref:sporulation protein n=1 Tax=Lactonifactor TaxID=420345 RepID=UPI0012B0F160|nr:MULTISPECIES: sporulation protein [Lactonifactor]MCB5712890.1 sporulation protein [Lactonifactor longoviformis]MCB5717032.1 sporulation protein [Lactonifactor longoviformis]MSA01791.1 sporulation protein [Lactonifactor sp. BIOML-A5]MSA08305.1 sporulation protein [Lactonifactor sp. BIOML-A4]MSA12727.1 sporulation protein [Lactonifactor sp. BIOML-A3]
MKKRWYLLPLLLLLFFLLFCPEIAFAASKRGLLLWFQSLLPSLLPFMILSNILIKTNVLEKWIALPKKLWNILFGLSPNGAYALLLGVFCGYPMGAKVTADLYGSGKISREEACYLLTFSNHPGPMFVSSFLLLETLHKEEYIGISFLILYTGSFITSLLFRSGYKKKESHLTKHKKEVSRRPPLGVIIDTSIMNGFEGITKLGGYIILFSVCSGMIQTFTFLPAPLRYALLGITEISTGTAAIAQTACPFFLKYAIIMALTSFGGLCIMAQTKSMINETSLPLMPYVKGKLCSLAITFLLALLIVQIV